jgi:hypothetical protein
MKMKVYYSVYKDSLFEDKPCDYNIELEVEDLEKPLYIKDVMLYKQNYNHFLKEFYREDLIYDWEMYKITLEELIEKIERGIILLASGVPPNREGEELTNDIFILSPIVSLEKDLARLKSIAENLTVMKALSKEIIDEEERIVNNDINYNAKQAFDKLLQVSEEIMKSEEE